MKVLLISQYLPFHPKSGVEQRIYNLLRCLSHICSVTCVIFTDSNPSEKEKTCDLPIDVHVFEKTESISPFRYAKNLLNVLFLSAKTKEQLESLVNTINPDVFWVEFGYLSHMSKFLTRYSQPIVYSTHNAQFELDYNIWRVNSNSLYKLKMAPFVVLYKLHELLYLDFNDLIICISGNDIGYYKKYVAISKIKYLPFIFGNKSIEETGSYRPDHPYICIVGSLGSYQNYQATAFMIDKIWPGIQKKYPDLYLYVVGDLPPKTSREFLEISRLRDNNANVVLTGHVPSVIPYVKGAVVNVAPLLLGSGIRTKIIESVACRTPVVSSAIGAEGLPFINGESIIIADGVEEFQEKILELVDDRKKGATISENAYEIYLREFSIDAGVHKLTNILETLIPAAKPALTTPVYND